MLKESTKKLKKAWLTINRFCNFRCPWCYAECTGYKNEAIMPLKRTKLLVDFLKTLGVEKIILTGGEPTYHPDFFEIIDYIAKQNIDSTLLTNGFKFHNENFVKKIQDSPISNIQVSIKAGSAEKYRELTGVDVFKYMLKAIANLKSFDNKRLFYAATLTKDIIGEVEQIVKMVAEDKNKRLNLSFAIPSLNSDGSFDNSFLCGPEEIVDVAITKFDSLSNIINRKLKVLVMQPLCMFTQDNINIIKKRNLSSSGCDILGRGCLYIETDGSFLMCNHFPNFPYGKYGVDFTTKEEFENFWDKNEIKDLYDKTVFYPRKECANCIHNDVCIGGCPVLWFSYDPNKMEFKYP